MIAFSFAFVVVKELTAADGVEEEDDQRQSEVIIPFFYCSLHGPFVKSYYLLAFV
jgi:hypothetical protein